MKKTFTITLLAILFGFGNICAQVEGTYRSVGYFKHPTSPRTMLLDKVLYKTNDTIFYTNIGDLSNSTGTLVLTLHKNNTVTYEGSYTTSGSVNYSIIPTKDSINNYDPLLKKFNLHYEYTIAGGIRSIREVLTKNAAGSKTIQLTNAGTLFSNLSSSELNTLTDLAITGTIDARDFKTLRDNMPALTVLDLSGVTIVGYSGTGGTSLNFSSANYSANSTPEFAFCKTDYTSKLQSINLPLTLTTIDSWTFQFCEKLNKITIPNTVNSIGTYAFCDCISLSGTFTIPSSLTFLGAFPFYACSSLSDFYVSTGNQYFSTLDGVLFNKTQTTLIECLGANRLNYTIPSTVTCIGFGSFETCSQLTNVIIPSSVKIISCASFSDCYDLQSLTIPSSVITIETNAFGNCNNLKSIYANSIVPIDLSNTVNVFKNVSKTTCTLYVPFGSKTLYQNASEWKNFTNIVESATEVPLVNTENIKLYPNPTLDYFNVSGIEDKALITITDINGKTLITKQIKGNENIEVGMLSKGMYLVKIITSDGIIERKLIKQ
jgi:hypothetical protein